MATAHILDIGDRDQRQAGHPCVAGYIAKRRGTSLRTRKGRLFLAATRLMIGQFALINFFRTGKL
jgi:hypothetical protein